MTSVSNLLETAEASPLSEDHADELARRLGTDLDLSLYPASIFVSDGSLFFMARSGLEKQVGIISESGVDAFTGEHQPIEIGGEHFTLQLCLTTEATAAALRTALPHTAPRVLGLRKSVGCGDRLGLATPGHVRAVRGSGLVPIFAQQSIREMTRTERTPRQVIDDATWGVFQEGWAEGYGADADHLKTPEDVDRCVEAGFTFFTIDPSDYVDNGADAADASLLRSRYDALPWDALAISPEAMRRYYTEKPFELKGFQIEFDEETLRRAAVKYAAAIAHTAKLYRHLGSAMADRPFELEMSVDETDTPTTVAEHYFVASELRRLEVECVSLAPRFVGRMEKGVDYMGDLGAFERSLVQHVAIARQLGPYKLSLHSGSDKFTLYGLFARHAGELFHLKTAGTSYLEALRAIARIDPGLFRQIFLFARERYIEDRATYHVSAELEKVPHPVDLTDEELPGVLDQFDARQVLHVTFGSVLTARDSTGAARYRDQLMQTLREDEGTHYETVERHFLRHLEPF